MLPTDTKIVEIKDRIKDYGFVNAFCAEILKIEDKLVSEMTDAEKELSIIALKERLKLNPVFDFGKFVSIENKQGCLNFNWNLLLPIPIKESTDHVTTILFFEAGAYIERILNIELNEDNHEISHPKLDKCAMDESDIINNIIVPLALYDGMGIEMKYKEKKTSVINSSSS
jgi:hypothetical protein